jgi:LysR family transcriptional regulator, glycine cleavage system transcriptional activator
MNPRKLTPSMSLLLAFEASARHLSFTRASEELALTQSAVSRQVMALEQMLEVQLFQRIGRKILLTDVGSMYVRELGGALGRIRDATLQAIAYRSGGGSIHLAVLPTFGSKWLLPRLHSFYAQNPSVQIHIHSRIGRFDLALAGMDAVITTSADGVWPGLLGHKILHEELIPVVSPAMFKLGNSSPKKAIDLTQHLLLQVATRPNVWREWFTSHQLPLSSMKQGPTFELTSHLIQAVSAGIGVGLVPKCLVEDELQSGSLMVAANASQDSGLDYCLFIPPHKIHSAPVAAFYQWMVDLTAPQK